MSQTHAQERAQTQSHAQERVQAHNPVVKKYAKTLFDITYSSGTAGQVGRELSELSSVFAGEALSFFESPFNSIDHKLTTVKSALEGRVSAETFNFLVTLTNNERLNLLKDISKEFGSLVLTSAGITKGKIMSAQALDAEFIKKAEASASKALGKKVELTFEKNPALIAGFKVEVAGWTMDDSAQIHFKILKDELMKKGL